MIATPAYRDWIVEDLTAEHLDGEAGELVATPDQAAAIVAAWADLHAAQAAATP